MLDEAVGVGGGLLYLSCTQANPGVESALTLFQHDDAGPVGEVVIHSVATGVAAVSQQYLVPHGSIVVVVVVSHKAPHHVALLFDGREEAAVEYRRADGLHAVATKDAAFASSCLTILWQGDMKEGQGR